MKILYKEQPHLHQPGPLDAFLGIPPTATDGADRAQAQLKGRLYPRAQLVDILADYNQEIGNDAQAMKNIAALKDPNSACVITGQQVGLMGGPSYTILKGITCLLAARETGAIPIFWAATEDHDIAEIDHTYLQDTKGNLREFRLKFSREGHFVEDLILSDHHLEEICSFCEEANFSRTLWEPPLRPGDSFAGAMMRLLVQLFAGTGLVFVEPKLLRPLAVPFVQKEIRESMALFQVLQGTTQRLISAGGDPILNLEEPTNLFYKTDQGLRRKVRREGERFLIGEEAYTEEQLLLLSEQEPMRWSCNAAARTVLQSLLFPTLAYVAGPTELGYFRQLLDYHRAHGVPMPWIVHRLSATFIPRDAANDLEACGLEPWDPIPEKGAQQHRLRNLLHPHHTSQERLLNWLGFQGKTQENMVRSLLSSLDWHAAGHYYCWI